MGGQGGGTAGITLAGPGSARVFRVLKKDRGAYSELLRRLGVGEGKF